MKQKGQVQLHDSEKEKAEGRVRNVLMAWLYCSSNSLESVYRVIYIQHKKVTKSKQAIQLLMN